MVASASYPVPKSKPGSFKVEAKMVQEHGRVEVFVFHSSYASPECNMHKENVKESHSCTTYDWV